MGPWNTTAKSLLLGNTSKCSALLYATMHCRDFRSLFWRNAHVVGGELRARVYQPVFNFPDMIPARLVSPDPSMTRRKVYTSFAVNS